MEAALQSDHVTLSVDGENVDVRYLHGGDGPPLVFLHGIGIDAATVSWRHVLPAMAEEHSVYALDFPGHGESNAPRRTYTTSYYVDVLASFLAKLDLREAGLVGLSMGGAVALGHALDGGSPRRMVLVDSYGLGADAYWRRASSTAVRVPFASTMLWGSVSTRAGVRSQLRGLSASTVPEALVEDVYATVTPTSMRALQSWQRHEFRYDGLRTDYRDRLDDLSVLTLLVHGTEDPLFPVSWSREANGLLGSSELSVLEKCGHWPPRERPELFNSVVADFCRT